MHSRPSKSYERLLGSKHKRQRTPIKSTNMMMMMRWQSGNEEKGKAKVGVEAKGAGKVEERMERAKQLTNLKMRSLRPRRPRMNK